jgi:hypothetical protein
LIDEAKKQEHVLQEKRKLLEQKKVDKERIERELQRREVQQLSLVEKYNVP